MAMFLEMMWGVMLAEIWGAMTELVVCLHRPPLSHLLIS